jgi:polyisoprenyl-phosphate glycosyltransferase
MPAPRNVSDFRLVDRIAYRTFLDMPERYRVMRHMWAWMGFRSIGIETERPARGGGHSHFNFWATFHSALRTILAQTRTPLVFIPMFGLSCAAVSVLLLGFEIVRASFFGVPFGGFGTIVALMLLLFSLLFAFLWMVSEYIGMIYEEVRHRPVYIVSQTDGLERAYRRRWSRLSERTAPATDLWRRNRSRSGPAHVPRARRYSRIRSARRDAFAFRAFSTRTPGSDSG